MALVDVNGSAVIDGRFWFPRTGAWRAKLRVDSIDPITGPVTISIWDGRLVLQGFVWRGAEYVETAYLNIVGGAGGLRSPARARAYNLTSLRIVLGDLLTGTGERLSPTADAATLAKQLPAWTTAALSTGLVLARALRSADPTASWRVLPDGTVWVGPETWPDSGLTTDDYQILDEDPRQNLAILGVEAPLLLPGTTLVGRRVSRVEHAIEAEGVRSFVWFEDAEAGMAPATDRLKDALGAVVRSVERPDYHALYWARVIAQRGSTIDVAIDNPTIAAFLPSLSQVPLTMPAAGASVQMAATGRVLVGWSGGDPAKPYALAPTADTAMQQLVLNVLTSLSLGDTSAQPFPNGAFFTALQLVLNGMLTAATTAASATLDAGAAAFFTALVGLLTTFEASAAAYLTTKAKAT